VKEKKQASRASGAPGHVIKTKSPAGNATPSKTAQSPSGPPQSPSGGGTFSTPAGGFQQNHQPQFHTLQPLSVAQVLCQSLCQKRQILSFKVRARRLLFADLLSQVSFQEVSVPTWATPIEKKYVEKLWMVSSFPIACSESTTLIHSSRLSKHIQERLSSSTKECRIRFIARKRC